MKSLATWYVVSLVDPEMALGYSIEILAEAIYLGAAHWLYIVFLLAVASMLVVILVAAYAAVVTVVAELVCALLVLARVSSHLQA